LLVDWILALGKGKSFRQTESKAKEATHSVPFGHHSLLFKTSKFSSIVDRCQQFPQQQHGHANKDNGCNDTENDAEKENLRRTFGILLRSHSKCDGSVLLDGFAVNELVTTIVFVVERAEMFIAFLVI
jgi:hypothetical protein